MAYPRKLPSISFSPIFLWYKFFGPLSGYVWVRVRLWRRSVWRSSYLIFSFWKKGSTLRIVSRSVFDAHSTARPDQTCVAAIIDWGATPAPSETVSFIVTGNSFRRWCSRLIWKKSCLSSFGSSCPPSFCLHHRSSFYLVSWRVQELGYFLDNCDPLRRAHPWQTCKDMVRFSDYFCHLRRRGCHLR